MIPDPGPAPSYARDVTGDAEEETQRSRAAWCGWCGAAVLQPDGPGRPRRWCSAGCRQQAHVARKLASAAGMGDDQMVVSRRDHEALLERVAVLRAAVADVDRVPPLRDDPTELARALDWILSHARVV